MWGINLAVYQFYFFFLKELNIIDKCVFTGISNFAEHAFAKKYFIHSNTIAATNQFSVQPRFGAMRITKLMKFYISSFNVFRNPGTQLVFARTCFAIVNHFCKCFIDSKAESILFNKLLHAFANLQFWRK